MTRTTLAALAASTMNISPIAFASTPPADTKPRKPREAPQIVAATGFALDLPEVKTNRGSKSEFPFETLAVGQAFGVKGRDKKAMSSIISNANKKYRVQQKDAEGKLVFEQKPVTDANGVQVGTTNGKPVFDQTREFFAYDVDATYKAKIKGTPLEGSTVLVFRKS